LKLWLPEQLKDYNLTEEKKLGKKDYKSMKGGGWGNKTGINSYIYRPINLNGGEIHF
jgi:hypothetical protein